MVFMYIISNTSQSQKVSGINIPDVTELVSPQTETWT